jgi:glycine/D-amino acid oxidase-like deaminating enzyme
MSLRRKSATSVTGRSIPNGDVSYWYSQAGLPTPRETLPGDRDADVCIVGAGFTGLWTAYYLLRERPDLRVVLLDKEFAGFGASGRNGGWLSSELAGSRERYAASHGHDGVVNLLRAMRSAVDEVIRVANAEGIDADIIKNGLLHVARNRAQAERLQQSLEYERYWGAGPQDITYLNDEELRERVVVADAMAATFSPHCARVQPAKLVQGLAEAVERMGARIYEHTTVREIVPSAAHTNRGVVTAPIVLRCLEGFTASIKGQRRNWLPMNSSMIVTKPLPGPVMRQIGWDGAELLGDFAHGYMYAQRTADDRIALGGRGIPYRYGSRTDRRGRTQQATITSLTDLLHRTFPMAAEVDIDQAWCGVLGVPRDWCATVDLDPSTGLGTAGGYVGSGLTTTNLAGRTLADLALKRQTDLTALPWVGRRVRQWEPEPLRWLGVQAMYALYRVADNREYQRGLPHTSRVARIANTITGR